ISEKPGPSPVSGKFLGLKQLVFSSQSAGISSGCKLMPIYPSSVHKTIVAWILFVLVYLYNAKLLHLACGSEYFFVIFEVVQRALWISEVVRKVFIKCRRSTTIGQHAYLQKNSAHTPRPSHKLLLRKYAQR